MTFRTPIYLVLDNAGGLGTTLEKRTFGRVLKRKFNVICVWQVANSLDTNILDLGAWAAVQSKVEERHRKYVIKMMYLQRAWNMHFIIC